MVHQIHPPPLCARPSVAAAAAVQPEAAQLLLRAVAVPAGAAEAAGGWRLGGRLAGLWGEGLEGGEGGQADHPWALEGGLRTSEGADVA